MTDMSRRTFLRNSALFAALTPCMRVLGANDDIRVAIVGLRGKGHQHMHVFRRIKGVRIVALCDVDRKILQSRLDEQKKAVPDVQVEGFVDFRKLLERQDIDAVCLATPNHWHALQTIWACQAGKHVYVEKPVCHTIYEGRKMAEAARKYGVIVQAGFQNRSDRGLRRFYPWLREGHIGKVTMIRGLCYRRRGSIGKRDTPLKPPPHIDYNLWLGPAEDLPIYRPRLHYDWHWVWNTGNGDIGNQGPHEMDLINWTLGDVPPARNVISFGNRFAWHDAGETPNMQLAVFDFGNEIPVLFEVRDLSIAPDKRISPHFKGVRVGLVITCEGGEFRGGRGGGWVYSPDGKRIKQFRGDGGGSHQANFIDAVRNHDERRLRVHISDAVNSSDLSHLANISYRVGHEATPQELHDHFKSDPVVSEVIERFSKQLEAWRVDFKKEPWILGASLRFDPEKERFVGDSPIVERANALVHRKDRPPFLVPGKV